MANENSREQRFKITKYVVDQYARDPKSSEDSHASALEILRSMHEDAGKNLGINRDLIAIAREDYAKKLLELGKPVKDDPILSFMDQQLAFNNKIGGTLDTLFTYQRRFAEAKERAEAKDSDIIQRYEEPPKGFFNPKQFERLLVVDGMLQDRVSSVMPELGFPKANVEAKFCTVKIPPFGKRKDTYFTLNLLGYEIPKVIKSFGIAENGFVTLEYSPIGGFPFYSTDRLSVNYLPTLVPGKKRYSGWVDVNDAYSYLDSPDADLIRHPVVGCDEITKLNVDKLLKVIAAGATAELLESSRF